MSVTIKRVDKSKYVLIDSDETEIATYEQTRMRHPDDWLADAHEAGESVSGPYGWTYVDERDQS